MADTLSKEELKHLRNLSKRATDNHVIKYGSASIVIHASEFHALEEAIKILSKGRLVFDCPHPEEKDCDSCQTNCSYSRWLAKEQQKEDTQ